jgi:O-antigen/teichoic acid export membrane protein
VFSLSSLLRFVRTDVLWVLAGQLIALIVGLISLKIFTNIFTAEQYAFIALMMALSGWIWMGLYQPLNQTIFRFHSLAVKQGWQANFFSYVWQYEKNLIKLVGISALLILFCGVLLGQSQSLLLLVLLSSLMGVSYGAIHGVISFYVAQRKRKPVTLIQSADGAFRLLGGLIAFYWFSQSEYATAVGMVIAGMVLFGIVLNSLGVVKQFKLTKNVGFIDDDIEYRQGFYNYFKKMFVVMILNASIIHLDKWLLFALLGPSTIGKYAVVYLLAMTITSMMYVFFEMVGFPLVINQQSLMAREKYQFLLTLVYAVCLLVVTIIIYVFGEELLLFLTTDYVASEHKTFTLLVIACGLLNLGRILMVQGQVDMQPHKYWPAYLVLLCFFIGWCFLFAEYGGSLVVAEGYVYGTMIFVFLVVILNLRLAKN